MQVSLGIILLSVFTGSLSSLSKDEGDTSLGRLPTDLYPINYQLELQPDIYTGAPPFFFNGSVTIRVECEVPTNIVYLNSDGINIDHSSIDITVASDSPVSAPQPVYVRHDLDETLLFLKIFLDDYLVTGAQYILNIKFDGTMKDPSDQDGLYWASYVSILDGSTNYVSSTQFQPHGARQTFPCFDEPLFKATFDVTILRSPDVISLGNGQLVQSQDRGNGWIADVFNTTQKMSSYLLCFSIGAFDYYESFTASGTPVRVYGRAEYMQDLEHANNIAVAMQDWFEEWTGLVDPSDKVDHIAVPGKVGAMENWGLVTYSEGLLMYNSSINYLSSGREVGSVIGHELAHFWFGDLVTTRWWDDSWLNEGFASYFQDLPFDDILGIDGDDQAILQRIRYIMMADSKASSTPVRVEIESPWQAGDGFSDFTYNKGSAVLRMIRQFLGEGTFQRGIQKYIGYHAFGSVVSDDLWDALTEQAEEDGVTDTDGLKLFVKEKMDPWIDQRGYPLVTFTITAPGTADVTQTQFLNPRNQIPPPSPFQYEWYIPLTLANQQVQDWNTQTDDWLNMEDKSISAGLPNATDQWFVANIDQSGFYRVKYDQTSYMLLADQLHANSSVIPYLNRYAILNDAIEISRSGAELETYAMEVTRFLDQEDTLVVWSTAAMGMDYPSLMLDRYPDTFTMYEQYYRTKIDPAYARFGWENGNDDFLQQGVRAVLLELACNYGNSDCHQNAQTRFADLMANPDDNSIVPDQRMAVYCTSIGLGSQADWDFLHSQYLSIADHSVYRGTAEEVDRILVALACSNDDSLIQRYISYAFDPALVRSSDVALVADAIATSSRGRWVMWEILQSNWTSAPVPNGVNKLDILQSVVEGFATAADVAELESFIATFPPVDDAESAAFDEALTTANTNMQWADTNEPALNMWFINNTSVHSGGVASRFGLHMGLNKLLLRAQNARIHGKDSPWHGRYNRI